MRPWIICIAVATLCSGCNHLALERNTVQQASTLSDLQYQQVLDNLAMFACNPDALAWQLKINSGTVQVTNQGTVGLLGNAGGTGSLANSITPSGTAVRGILGQWNVVPVVETEDLTSLQLA